MVKNIILTVIFFLSMFLVIKGNTINGYLGLLIIFIGMVGILGELYIYNKKYQ
ncbi:hypothetical protein NE398_14310 [Clostridium tertium]|jgi:hypothetical protein|uniref:Uncharacterized protein n=1 Tax=Clostridium tertium TaxID=1559 RepID=A0A9X4B352_9CLOT|nr:hypothetical protein [Clostridium tertium]MDC4241326.1 hypothetical protein [Clostridium tertium]MDU8967172.1 hypothetical protein [Clostridium sp.]